MRNYKRKLGARNYATSYTPEQLRKAIDACKVKKMSYRKASKQFNIPYGTLLNKCKNKHSGKVGTPLRLTDECEAFLLQAIDLLAEWKVPLQQLDIRLLVKDYLDRKGVNDTKFKDNCPGEDWMKGFIRRHNLTQRLADNVKPARVQFRCSIYVHIFFKRPCVINLTP